MASLALDEGEQGGLLHAVTPGFMAKGPSVEWRLDAKPAWDAPAFRMESCHSAAEAARPDG